MADRHGGGRRRRAADLAARGVKPGSRRETMWCWLFLAPQLLAFLGFVLWPTVASWYFAFFDWDGIGVPEDFVGFANFAEVLGDPVFWAAFRNTMVYTFALVIIVVPLSLLVALALNSAMLIGKTPLRVLFVLPVVLTAAVVGLQARILFGTSGPVNTVLQALNLTVEPVQFLNDAVLAFAVLIGLGAWKTFGIKIIYWLAGLQTLPEEVYDAARVDGANAWRRFVNLTVPLLVPFFVVITVLQTLNGLRVFDLAKTLTNGGPYYATDMVSLYIFRYAFDPASVSGGGTFQLPRLGFASAAGLIYGLLAFGLSAVLGLLVRRFGRPIR